MRKNKKRELPERLFCMRAYFVIFVFFYGSFATLYRLDLDDAVNFGDGNFAVLRGPLAFHQPVAVSVVIGASGDDVHVIWMTGDQYHYALTNSPPSPGYPTECFPPSSQRALVRKGRSFPSLELEKVSPGRYYLAVVVCNKVFKDSIVQFNGQLTITTTVKPSNSFSLERFRWWVSTLFILQFLLYGFTLYAISVENQRTFWAPYGLLLASKTAMIIAETFMIWSFEYNTEVFLAEIFSALSSVWRAAAVPFVLWVCFGLYLQGSSFKMHRLVLPVLCVLGKNSNCSFVACFLLL